MNERRSKRPPIYLGDEVTAAGFRLAGAVALCPAPTELLPEFRAALARTDLLLLSVEAARRLPAREVNAALAGVAPLVVVVPDLQRRFALRDLPTRISRELGIR